MLFTIKLVNYSYKRINIMQQQNNKNKRTKNVV